ncbi:transglycosylase SLT domain-containing protein [Nocardia uniformis]|uniref:aggregation-promoting factor C-terminal-like domain-containing protein n=1 Tax=Nocardia uniformis TaxID=53432 RepID=UPI001FE1EEB7|nr:transglycosylase SLT domain-containing protein [Nocardia uniformis]
MAIFATAVGVAPAANADCGVACKQEAAVGLLPSLLSTGLDVAVTAYGLAPRAIAVAIVPIDQFPAFDAIITRESSWNIFAVNPTSGAYGLPQALPAHKMATHGPDWMFNPVTQIRWAYDYMNARYGSPNAAWAFWQANHWY